MRLVTRSDFDGLVCAAILQEIGLIEDILYVHPKDLQEETVDVTEKDILANVPYVEGCGLWFDHHSSERERSESQGKFKGISINAPSAARVIYDHYEMDPLYSERLQKFHDLVKIVDIADSAQYSIEDIINPQGWVLLAFIADPRTGLGYRHNFRIGNFDLMKATPTLLRTKTIDEILAMSDFKERIDVYKMETSKFKELLQTHSRVEGNIIVIDFRGLSDIPSGNRFIEYTLYPQQNISVRLADGKDNEFVMISVGHSIVNRTSNVNVGSLMLNYGGGGLDKAGTCQVPNERADDVLQQILDFINSR